MSPPGDRTSPPPGDRTSAPPGDRVSARLVSVTEPFASADGDLLSHLPASGGVAWLRHGEGFIGFGQALRIAGGTGPDRFRRAASAVREALGAAQTEDRVGTWGTGPIAFGSFTFDPDSEGSELVIPAVVIGRSGGRSWITRTGLERAPELDEVLADAGQAVPDGHGVSGPQPALDGISFRRAVETARAAIGEGSIDKVVLSLQATVTGPTSFDLRRAVTNLAGAYPGCYTFASGDFVGASPELLVRREGRSLRSVPLAGSTRRGTTPEEDRALQQTLLASAKDRWEHDLAVVTVVESLRPLSRQLRIDPEPSVLSLANVAHLATEITGELAGEETALEVAGAIHPTAAVCGTPTRRALALIRELEGVNRGRYAGPVGWVGANGDGEWAIALRCAELHGRSARLFAGAGIVAQSDPDAELEEVRLKLRPVLSALDLS
ncbi:MAG: isochorismate synthase [Actinomycetota bacterium]